MKLQIASRIALYAVLMLASHPDRQLSAADIARHFNVSLNHLAKVLRDLNRAGLVEAVRGAGGGYRFSGQPRRTTLYDIVDMFENVGQSAADVTGDEDGDPISQGLAQVFQEIDDIATSTLQSITIETMLKISERHRRRQTGNGQA